MSSKVKYCLSDGTPATIGRIVVVIKGIAHGNPAGTITKLLGDIFTDGEGLGGKCVWKAYPEDWLWEKLHDLRAATPEEKKRWKMWWRKNRPYTISDE